MLNFGLNENPFTLSVEKDEAILRQLYLLQVSTEKAYPGEMTYDLIHDWFKRLRVDYLFFNALLKKHGNVKFDIPEEYLDKSAKSFAKVLKRPDEEKVISTFKKFAKSTTLWGIVKGLQEVLKKDNMKSSIHMFRKDVANENEKKWGAIRFTFALATALKRAISHGKIKLIKLEDQHDPVPPRPSRLKPPLRRPPLLPSTTPSRSIRC